MAALAVAHGGGSGRAADCESSAKRLLLCECLCGLSVLSAGGCFVCKFFDVLSDFTAGLLFLVAQCFARFAVVKPFSSAPLSSERYCVFLNLRERSPPALSVLADAAARAALRDGLELASVFPVDAIPGPFREYLIAANTDLAMRQIAAIETVVCIANLASERWDEIWPVEREEARKSESDDLRRRCLAEWRLNSNPIEVKVQAPPAVDTRVLEPEAAASWNDDELETSELGAIIAKCRAADSEQESAWIERPLFPRVRPPNTQLFFAFGRMEEGFPGWSGDLRG
jgi:hypothetical protein